MKKFVFESKVEPVEICGKSYTFDVGNVDWMADVMEQAEKVEKEITELQKEEGWSRKKIDRLINVLQSAVDVILGEKEFERIFNSDECKRNVNYMAKLCYFLTDEIKAQSSGL